MLPLSGKSAPVGAQSSAVLSARYSANRNPATVGSTTKEPPSSIASGIMVCATSASTAPPATASQNTAASEFDAPMYAFPTAAATIPASRTVAHNEKIILGLKPALVSMDAP